MAPALGLFLSKAILSRHFVEVVRAGVVARLLAEQAQDRSRE